METMTFDEAKEYINSNPQVWLTPAKKRGYICPLCNNGAGNNGTGLELDPHSKQPYCYKCFKGECGFYGDMLQLIQDVHNLDSKKEAFIKACEIYGITLTADNLYSLNGNPAPVKAPVQKRAPEAEQKSKDYAEILHSMYNADNTHNACVYLQSRGISPETVQRLGFTFKHDCYDYNRQYRGDALIIPATREDGSLTYQERYLDIAPDVKDDEKHKSQWAPGKRGLFNPEALYQDKQPVFIVEGAIDASSIEELGFKAIAINSTSNTNLIAPAIQSTRTKAKRFILALDNDEDGRKTQNNFLISAEKALTNCVFGVNICEGKNYKDANEYLLHDREGLKKVLTETVEKVNTMRDTDPVPEIDKYQVKSIIPHFMNWISGERTPTAPTGITGVDNVIGGIAEGKLYVIGGLTGTGKSNIAINMAYNIAKQGRRVIYYSLEMTKETVFSRIISMIHTMSLRSANLLNDGMALKKIITESMIYEYLKQPQEIKDKIDAIIKRLEGEIGDNLDIVDDIHSMKQIAEHVKKHAEENPVIMFDYLQIINNNIQDPRISADTSLSKIAELRNAYKLPAIVISSINRASYNSKDISIACFKETSRVEYDADFAIVLDEKNPTKQQVLSKEVRFVSLKGRGGIGPGETILTFYPGGNLFV